MPKDFADSFRPDGRFPPRLANVALVTLLAMGAARLFWLLAPMPSHRSSNWHPQRSPVNVVSAATKSLQPILSAHLFGRPSQAKPAPVQAPETHLKLTLHGVLASTTLQRSRALIEGPGGKEKSYALGDTIEPGVTLTRILPDRVLIKRDGHFETLKLARAPAIAVQTAPPASHATDLAAVRRKLLHQPSKISRFVQMRPVYLHGNLLGWRVFPGSHRNLFRAVGLKPGDLVTSVNGIPLDSPSHGIKAMNALKQASQVTLTVNRGGRTHSLNVNLR